MSVTLNMHQIKTVAVEDLKPHTRLMMKVTDTTGMVITMFLDPDQLDIFADAVAAYRSPMGQAA